MIPAEMRRGNFGSFTDALAHSIPSRRSMIRCDAVDPFRRRGRIPFRSDSDLCARLSRQRPRLYTDASRSSTPSRGHRPLCVLYCRTCAIRLCTLRWDTRGRRRPRCTQHSARVQTYRASMRSKFGSNDELIDRAIACGDEHAIKFTEVCLREHALNPDPAFLAAAAHATQMLSAT